MQDVISTSQRPPVKPALQLHTKPVGNKYEVFIITTMTKSNKLIGHLLLFMTKYRKFQPIKHQQKRISILYNHHVSYLHQQQVGCHLHRVPFHAELTSRGQAAAHGSVQAGLADTGVWVQHTAQLDIA